MCLVPAAGVVQGRIQLVGLVGTYDQGLAHLNNTASSNNQHQQKKCAAGSGAGSSSSSCSQLLDALSLASAGEQASPDSGYAPSGSEDSMSCVAAGSADDDDSAAGNDASEPDDDACIEIQLQDGSSGSDAAGTDDESGTDSGSSGGKILLWLGSSIGNYTRQEGQRFVRRVKEAMQPGEPGGNITSLFLRHLRTVACALHCAAALCCQPHRCCRVPPAAACTCARCLLHHITLHPTPPLLTACVHR